MRSGVGQRAGAPQHRRLVQRAEQRFGGESLRREGRLEAGGEGIGHALELVGAPAAQPQHRRGREGGGSRAVLGGLPFRRRKAHRLQHAEAAAKLWFLMWMVINMFIWRPDRLMAR